MNKAVPWRIKGVDFDAREAAADAARRSGMSLGDWLNTVIAEHADETGMDIEDFDANDRLDAVTRRLSHMSERGSGRTRRRNDRLRSGGESRSGSDNYDEEFDGQPSWRNRRPDTAPLRPSASRPARGAEPGWHDPADAERLLESAIESFERRTNRSSERTARALADVADLIQTSNKSRDRDDEALSTISTRLAHIERKVAQRPAEEVSRPVHDALARLERRMESLAKRPERPVSETAIRDIDARLNDIAAKLDDRPARAEIQSHNSARSLDSRLNDIAARLDERRPAKPDAETADRLARLESKIGKVLEKVAGQPAGRPDAESQQARALDRRLTDLAARIDDRRTPAADPETADRLARLESKIGQVLDTVAVRAPIPPPIGSEPHMSPKPGKRPLAALMADVARRQRDLDSGDAAFLPSSAERRERNAFEQRAPQTTATADIEARLASIAERLEKSAAAPVAAPAPDLSGLQGNINTLSERIEQMRADITLRAARPAPAAANSQMEQIRRDISEMARAAKTAPAAIPNEQIEQLRRDINAMAQASKAASAPIDSSQVEQLRRDITAISQAAKSFPPASSDHIEQLRRDINAMAQAAKSGSSASNDQIEQMRRDIGAMAKVLSELAPRASVSALERAVRDIGVQIENSRLDGVNDAILAPLEMLTRDLRAMVKDFDPRASIAGLEREIHAIGDKLASVGAPNEADPATIKAIFEQTREVRDILQRTVDGQLPGERIESGLAQLAARVEGLSGANAGNAQRGDVNNIVDEIRTLITDPLLQDRTLQALEHRLEGIADRLDSVFGERLDTMHRTLAAGLTQARSTSDGIPFDSFVNDLGARIDAALGTGIETMQRTLFKAIENAPSAPAPSSESRLEAMVGDLAAKIDAAVGARSDDAALDAMHQQIERLSRQFEKTDTSSESLVALERTVSELFSRVDAAHLSAVDAAEAAARSAARAALREEMSAGNLPASVPGEISQEITREIADLRSMQDVADHRTHATLTAVHETLERVVDRLATLEDDLADVRHSSSETATLASGATPKFEYPATADRQSESADSRAAQKPPVKVEPKTQEAAKHDPEVLIEPGFAFARRAGSGRGADEADASGARPQANFIQAARRAAQAAAATADFPPAAPDERDAAKASAPIDQVRAYVASRKRPILLSLAALMVLGGTVLIARVAGDDAGSPRPAAQAAKTSSQADRPLSSAAAADAAAQGSAQSAAQTAPDAPKDLPKDMPKDMPKADAPPDGMTPPVKLGPPPTLGRKADASIPALGAPSPQAGFAPPSAAPNSPGSLDNAPVGSINRNEQTGDSLGIVRSLATQGDAAAQYELAVRYADGKTLNRDLKSAANWFEKAATKGLVPAQYRLGAMYERGLGVTRDPVIAKLWYQRAADKGNARAMHNLAVLLADGSDGKPNYSDAIVWFKRAAELGVRDSQYNLAILYARGLGTSVNLEESYLWFAAAASQGDTDAAAKRDDVASRLPAADLARAKAAFEAFKPQTPNTAANDVFPPPGGWAANKPPAHGEPKPLSRSKVSTL